MNIKNDHYKVTEQGYCTAIAVVQFNSTANALDVLFSRTFSVDHSLGPHYTQVSAIH